MFSPRSPIGRGTRLKIGSVSVRVRPGVPPDAGIVCGFIPGNSVLRLIEENREVFQEKFRHGLENNPGDDIGRVITKFLRNLDANRTMVASDSRRAAYPAVHHNTGGYFVESRDE